MKLLNKINIYNCLLIVVIVCYFYVTRFSIKESLQTQPLEQKISIESTGVDNIVNLNESRKEKDIINLDYNNKIDQKEISYDDGNTLINTYSEIIPLKIEEAKLDGELNEYKNTEDKTDRIRSKLNEYNTEISIIQKQLKTYNDVETEYQQLLAKNSALKNDMKNLDMELSDCENSSKTVSSKIIIQDENIKNLEQNLNTDTFNTTVKNYNDYASKYSLLGTELATTCII